MEHIDSVVCTICGKQRMDASPWWLVAEDRWQDKLQILHWDESLAGQPGVHSVCNPIHLQQLAVHWMTTGSLDHPFAWTAADGALSGRWRTAAPLQIDLPKTVKWVGELAVHRESMNRVLKENTESLQAMLDALVLATQPASSNPSVDIDWDEAATRTVMRDV